MSSSVGCANEVLRGPEPAPHELGGVVEALDGADGSSAARQLLDVPADARNALASWLDLTTRALDLAMPIDVRLALLSARARVLRRGGDVDGADRDHAEACALANKAGFRREEARLLGELGMSAFARCDFATALARFEAALDIQTVLGDAAEQAVTWTQLALVRHELGAGEDARVAAARALTIERVDGSPYEVLALVEMARCELDAGELDRARARIASARALADGRADLEVYARLVGAMVEHAAGSLDLAEGEYAAVIHASREASDRSGLSYGLLRIEGGAFAGLGLVAFDRGDLPAAASQLDNALTLLVHSGGTRHAALVKAYLAACAALGGDGDGDDAEASFAEARDMLAPHDVLRAAIDVVAATISGSPLLPDTVQHAASSWEGRHALERYERTVGHQTPEAIETECVFSVAMDGAWLEHDGHHVSCSRRAATQRLLAALARARADAPGRPVPIDELVAAGWPDEDLPPAAGKNRLRVALSWLRKHGLGRGLSSQGDGYLLDPTSVAVSPPRG